MEEQPHDEESEDPAGLKRGKRRGQGRQLRREEVENDSGEEEGGPGEFKKASTEELAKRKFVRVTTHVPKRISKEATSSLASAFRMGAPTSSSQLEEKKEESVPKFDFRAPSFNFAGSLAGATSPEKKKKEPEASSGPAWQFPTAVSTFSSSPNAEAKETTETEKESKTSSSLWSFGGEKGAAWGSVGSPSLFGVDDASPSLFAQPPSTEALSSTPAPETPSLPELKEEEVKTGEESELCVQEVRARLYKYDEESKEWKERGVGSLRVLQEKGEKDPKSRLVMRVTTTLRLVLNSALFPQVKVQLKGNKVIVQTAEEDVPVMYLIRVASKGDAEELSKTIERVKGVEEAGKEEEEDEDAELAPPPLE